VSELTILYALILFIQTLALYKSFTYLLTKETFGKRVKLKISSCTHKIITTTNAVTAATTTNRTTTTTTTTTVVLSSPPSSSSSATKTDVDDVGDDVVAVSATARQNIQQITVTSTEGTGTMDPEGSARKL